jgi:hypothetical protein
MHASCADCTAANTPGHCFPVQHDAKTSTTTSVIVIVGRQFAVPDMIQAVQYSCIACPGTDRQTVWCRSEAAHLEHEVIGAKASQAADHTHGAL